MCPGGEVIAAASEPGGVCTNGMSNSRRNGENANSALLVTLPPEDFPYEGPLGGMYWQRDIERAAFAASGSYRRRRKSAILSHTGKARGRAAYCRATAPAFSGVIFTMSCRSG